MTPAALDTRAVVAAARAVVRHSRWFQDLPADRPLPCRLQAALEAALQALDRKTT